MKFILISILTLLTAVACWEEPKLSEAERSLKILADISSKAELNIPSGSRLIEFLEENPYYNPRWVAKIALPANESARMEVEKDLSTKTISKSSTRDPLSAKVPWWYSQDPIVWKKYRTSYWAVVKASLLYENGVWMLYISWVAP
jgi:hypothetical protein